MYGVTFLVWYCLKKSPITIAYSLTNNHQNSFQNIHLFRTLSAYTLYYVWASMQKYTTLPSISSRFWPTSLASSSLDLLTLSSLSTWPGAILLNTHLLLLRVTPVFCKFSRTFFSLTLCSTLSLPKIRHHPLGKWHVHHLDFQGWNSSFIGTIPGR